MLQAQVVSELVMEFLKRVLPKFEAAKAGRNPQSLQAVSVGF